MRRDTDLILIEQQSARRIASGMAVAQKPQGGVPYRWAGSRLQERAEAAPPPFDGYEVHVPSARMLGRSVGRVMGGTPLQWMGVLLLLGVLALAAIPVTSCGCEGEARSSEARAALGAMKDRARVIYQRTGKAPANMNDLCFKEYELRGSYFTEKNYRITSANPNSWTAVCTGVCSAAPHELVLTADLENGKCDFNR
ncbi:hypothetical protein PLCT2_00622 [Planctomycetaceae bacterium]|nr:hypothetical protein PLCT2_00622 [Planctomycetaceae bacterium]